MPKLNQIIAVVNGKKNHAENEVKRITSMMLRGDLLQGLSRTYKPKDEDGDRFPNELKHPQYSVKQGLKELAVSLKDLFNATATMDATNGIARANVIVDGVVLLYDVPATHLLFLEKRLDELNKLVQQIPLLDPSHHWTYDESVGCYRTDEQQTVKTKKVMKNHEKAPATDKHPAQVEIYTEDVVIGYWTKTDFATAIPLVERNTMLDKIRKLREAVKFAKEEANDTDVINYKTDAVLEYIFGVS